MKTNIKYVSSFLGVILMGPKESETLSFGMEKKVEKATNISGRQNHG